MKLDTIDRAYGAELVKRYREKAGKSASTSSGTIAVRGSARSPRAIGTLRPAGKTDATTTIAAAKATRSANAKPVTEAEFVAAFKRLGLSTSAAETAARGRGVKPAKSSSLIESGRALGLSRVAAKAFARGRSGLSEVAKDVAGLPANCYAYTPDVEDPLTWKLQIARSADNGNGVWTPDEDLVRAAVAQLPGIAGYEQAIDIPAAALPGVKAVLRSAWISCGASVDELPRELAQEALRKPFERLGIKTEVGMQAAMRGRERRR
jgi:hypothetical protein